MDTPRELYGVVNDKLCVSFGKDGITVTLGEYQITQDWECFLKKVFWHLHAQYDEFDAAHKGAFLLGIGAVYKGNGTWEIKA